MMRNQEINGAVILGPLFSKWMWVFQLYQTAFQLEDKHLFKLLLHLQ